MQQLNASEDGLVTDIWNYNYLHKFHCKWKEDYLLIAVWKINPGQYLRARHNIAPPMNGSK